MPFRSKAQRRFFYAAAARGDMPQSTVDRWEEETPKGKKLPEKVKKEASFMHPAFREGFEKSANTNAMKAFKGMVHVTPKTPTTSINTFKPREPGPHINVPKPPPPSPPKKVEAPEPPALNYANMGFRARPAGTMAQLRAQGGI